MGGPTSRPTRMVPHAAAAASFARVVLAVACLLIRIDGGSSFVPSASRLSGAANRCSVPVRRGVGPPPLPRTARTIAGKASVDGADDFHAGIPSTTTTTSAKAVANEDGSEDGGGGVGSEEADDGSKKAGDAVAGIVGLSGLAAAGGAASTAVTTAGGVCAGGACVAGAGAVAGSAAATTAAAGGGFLAGANSLLFGGAVAAGVAFNGLSGGDPPSTLEDMVRASTPLEVLVTEQGRGRPTVMEFYGTACPRCRDAARTLKSVEERAERDLGFNWVMVNTDDPATEVLWRTYRVDELPHFEFFDARGREVAYEFGAVEKGRIEERIAQAAAAATAASAPEVLDGIGIGTASIASQ